MTNLALFDVTVRAFDPDGGATIADHVLPVRSPDAEHAAASTLANAISWTAKTAGGAPLPVAFRVIEITPRG